MKGSEVREYSSEELKNLLEDKRRQLFDLRSQSVTEKLEDPTLLRKTKVDIARILTILRERGIKDLSAKLPQEK